MNKDDLVGTCPICEINVYNRGNKNKPFLHGSKTKMGFPSDVAMPCGISRENSTNKDLKDTQKQRCPFETKEQQERIDLSKAIGIFSGSNNWDSVVD